jgi:TonB-linked SusC/RagA family outer membrane protein
MKKKHCIPYASPGLAKMARHLLRFPVLLALLFAISVSAEGFNGGLTFQGKITGKVTDAQTGETLPGVYVIIQGTTIGTTTDANGNYSISVTDKNSVLVFSFIGYVSTNIPIGDNSTIDVKLVPDIKSLDAVVVVGYGTQKKASLIGSVSSVKSEQIMEAPLPNLSQAITGRLPGLVTHQSSGQPGYDVADIYVRGFGTLNDNKPLVLVDGVERSFNTIDPSEVESVTVLKDATAASVYGVRGANGIILVTTKRGKEGKPSVTYSTNYSLSTNTRMPEYLNGEEFVKWYNYADEINGRSHTFSDEIVNKVTNGDPDGIYGNTNWIKKMLKPASVWHNSLSVNGGSKNVNYFVSLGNLYQPGIIKKVNYNRYNLRSNIDAKITEDFSIALNVAGDVANSKSPQIANFTGNGASVSTNLMNQIITAQPYLKPYSPDGLPLVSTLMKGNNPMAARDLSGFYDTDNTGLQTSLTLTYNTPFIKGLSFKATGSYDRNYYHTKSYYTPYSLYVVNISSSNPGLTETASPYGSVVQLSEGFEQYHRSTAQEYVTYKNTFGKSAIDFLFVAEQSEYESTKVGVYIQDFDLNDIPEISHGKNVTTNPTGSSYILHRCGWVDRINYTYNNKYLFEVSSRLDASTNFPKKNRYGFFPTASFGWRISEEDFFKSLASTITNLKLRVSTGLLGNDNMDETYQYMRFMTLSTTPVANIGGKNVNGLSTSDIPNYDLSWELARTTNGGFDLDLWNGLLSVQFDYFYKLTSRILTSVSATYPSSLGGNCPSIVNSGKVDNRGFELVLSHKNKIGYFNYTVTGNLTWAHNRILKMDESADLPEYESGIGKSLGYKIGFVSQGLFKSDDEARTSPNVYSNAEAGDIKYKDLNGDGKITYEQDKKIIGKSNVPELNYGINFESSWHNWDFNMLVQGAAICNIALMGYYENIGWDDTQYTRTFYNYGNTPKYLVSGSWTPDKPNNKYPRLDNQWRPENNYASTMWILNGAYVRLKSVQLGYTLPQAAQEKLKASLKIMVSATNVLTISSFKYVDPEAPDVSNGYYPQQKTFSLGATLIF